MAFKDLVKEVYVPLPLFWKMQLKYKKIKKKIFLIQTIGSWCRDTSVVLVYTFLDYI